MNISEIAKLAGVSSSAVSRYLNGGSLSKDKGERIRKVIEEHHYIPSSYARAMRTKRSYQIGVIVPKINSESVPRVISGISSVLNEAGYNFLLADTNNDPRKELEYLELFRHSQLDGVIFLATVITKKHKERMRSLNKPLVVIGQNVPDFACVYHNDYMAAHDMTELLLRAGCGKIACIGVTDKDIAAGKLRREGMEKAVQEHGMQPEEVVRVESDFSMESGRACMEEILKRQPDTDGVFCATDAIAVGAMMYLKESGKRIPDEICICGIGDNQMSGIISPPLATAHYYYKTSGIEAAGMLLGMIETEGQPVKQMMLGYEVKPQGTVR